MESPKRRVTQNATPARLRAMRARLAGIRLVVFDFDGVMTDNRVLTLQDGTEGVFCDRSDGLGIGLLARTGIGAMVLSKEPNPVVAARCRKLKLECVQGIDDKLPELKRQLEARGLKPAQVAYVGNDVNDEACMAHVGLPIAVADAYPGAMRLAVLVTQKLGGRGAVREVCEWLIGAQKGRGHA